VLGRDVIHYEGAESIVAVEQSLTFLSHGGGSRHRITEWIESWLNFHNRISLAMLATALEGGSGVKT
jgi:hypothetical protein